MSLDNKILHPELAALVASLGHTDTIMICDSGYPIPTNANKINLAVTENLPLVIDVVKLLSKNAIFEEIVVTEEMKTNNNELYSDLKKIMRKQSWLEIAMQDFMDNEIKAYIRTGDGTPYANVKMVFASRVYSYNKQYR